MITQEILNTFIYQTKSGKFGVTEPVELDSILGTYDTYEEAEDACIDKLIELTKQQNNG